MFARRIEAVRQGLAELRLQGLLVTSLPNIHYLTGFTGSNALLLMFPDRNLFFTDRRYTTQSSEEVNGAKVFIASGSLVDAVSKNLPRRRRMRIGIESDSFTVAAYKHLKRTARGALFTSTDGIVERIRVRKDEHEISKIKRAAHITDRVFSKILTILSPGVRELEVAAEIAYWHRRLGAESDAFEPIVASGPRGALPHARASSRKIAKGDLVTIDMGCSADGYHSDLTRTVSVGKPSTEMRKIYGIVLDAQSRSLDAAREGLRASVLDEVARSTIRRGGYGKFFCHSLGHGLGMEVHELPRISSKSKDVLQSGSVVTIEPGIYIPRKGGVRIEDDIIIRNTHSEVLSTVPRDLVIL